MMVILKYSDYGDQKEGPKLSHVTAIGPFDNPRQAKEHAQAMLLLASERWYYSICDLVAPVHD